MFVRNLVCVPSIHPSSIAHLSQGCRQQAKQSSPDLPLPSHINPWESQIRYIIPPAYSGSALWSPPSVDAARPDTQNISAGSGSTLSSMSKLLTLSPRV